MHGQAFADPNIAGILEEIDGAVQRADSVVRELLDFSAPKKMDRVLTDVNRLIPNALVLVRGELGKINVVQELAPDLPPVLLDAM